MTPLFVIFLLNLLSYRQTRDAYLHWWQWCLFIVGSHFLSFLSLASHLTLRSKQRLNTLCSPGGDANVLICLLCSRRC